MNNATVNISRILAFSGKDSEYSGRNMIKSNAQISNLIRTSSANVAEVSTQKKILSHPEISANILVQRIVNSYCYLVKPL